MFDSQRCLAYAAIVVIAGVMEAQAQVGAACRSLEPLAEDVRNYIVEVVTASDSSQIGLREALTLSPMPADSVSIVTDSTTCAAAATAYAHTHEPNPNPTIYNVWVIRIGSGRYAIFNTERAFRRDVGVFEVMIFDTDFNFKGAYVS